MRVQMAIWSMLPPNMLYRGDPMSNQFWQLNMLTESSPSSPPATDSVRNGGALFTEPRVL